MFLPLSSTPPQGRRRTARGLANVSGNGLTEAEAEERARTAGPNEIAQERKQGWLRPPSENHAQSAGDSADDFVDGFLPYRRRARRHP